MDRSAYGVLHHLDEKVVQHRELLRSGCLFLRALAFHARGVPGVRCDDLFSSEWPRSVAKRLVDDFGKLAALGA